MPKLQLMGRLVSSPCSSIKNLVAYLPARELVNYLSIGDESSDMEFIYDAAKNITNSKKVNEIQLDIKKSLISNSLRVPFSLTVVFEGKPCLSLTGEQGVIEYDQSRTFVVGNVLLFTAILKSLGIKTPLFSSRMSLSERQKQNSFKRMLSQEEVMLTLIFDDENGISKEQVKDFFFKFNRQNSGLHLTHFAKTEQKFPLRPFVNHLIDNLNLDQYGGVSEKSKHVRKSESFLTTEYILFKFLVGATAGAKVQEACKLSDNVTYNGSLVSSILAEGRLNDIELFLGAWLQPLTHNEHRLRTGFRLSAQIWQALSIVIFKLVSRGASSSELIQAGIVLGKLDYSKKAPHWQNCDVMDLDSNGRLYKNSANSTRDFRNGLADYFLFVIKQAETLN